VAHVSHPGRFASPIPFSISECVQTKGAVFQRRQNIRYPWVIVRLEILAQGVGSANPAKTDQGDIVGIMLTYHMKKIDSLLD
jgi:hypothetical protein